MVRAGFVTNNVKYPNTSFSTIRITTLGDGRDQDGWISMTSGLMSKSKRVKDKDRTG